MGIAVFTKRDETLVKQAVKGSDKAWHLLLTRYEKPIFNYALRMTGNADDGADLMQDIFISVYRSLTQYKGDGAFKSWLFRIAHFRCVEYYRRKRHWVDVDSVPEMESEASCHDVALHSSRQSRALIEAMQGLPLNQKAVIELKFFGHFTFEDIANQLDVSVNTVKSRLYSGLSKLKLELDNELS
ncbi:RNA polymerase sigma-H factor [Alteromonas sp. KUL49]|nr:RNA polymerase sigma-H factor [Alteromonas sp. KUL49]